MTSGKDHEKTKENSDIARRLSALGCPFEDIAKKLQISSDTLVRRYREELDAGRIDANSAVAGSLYKKAVNGDTQAAIFWLKTRGGKGVWKETDRLELTGADGGAIQTANIDMSKLDTDTLTKLLAARRNDAPAN
jgi:hypothetical protein